MRQIWITELGEPEVLQIQEAADPTPRNGEVRIRVEASGVNFVEVLRRMGAKDDASVTPYVPGYEVSGVVDAVAQGVPDLKEGDSVFAATRLGGYSDVVCVPHKQVFKRLQWMDAEDAAALPVNYLTAYAMLVVMGSLRAGDRVLIHAAADGVGLAALDICQLLGAETYGTAPPEKHEFLLERGLDHVIDLHNRDYERVVGDLTDGRGVQIVLDPLGAHHWRKNYRLLMATGRHVTFGVSGLGSAQRRTFIDRLRELLATPLYSPRRLTNDNKGVIGLNLEGLWDHVDLARSWMDQIIAWYDEALFRPCIDRTFKFTEASKAHRYIQERRNTGKVLLIP